MIHNTGHNIESWWITQDLTRKIYKRLYRLTVRQYRLTFFKFLGADKNAGNAVNNVLNEQNEFFS